MINDLRSGKLSPDPNADVAASAKSRIEDALGEIRKADAGIQICHNCGHEVDVVAPVVPEPNKCKPCCQADTGQVCPPDTCGQCGEEVCSCFDEDYETERSVIHLDDHATAIIQLAEREIAMQKGKIKGLIEYMCMSYPGKWTISQDGTALIRVEED